MALCSSVASVHLTYMASTGPTTPGKTHNIAGRGQSSLGVDDIHGARWRLSFQQSLGWLQGSSLDFFPVAS